MNLDENAPNDKPVYVERRYPDAYYPTVAAIPSREDAEEPTHLREYWNVILSHRWSVLAIILTVVTIAMISTFREKPVYRASASVQIDRENSKILSFQQNFEVDNIFDDDVLQTQFRILKSRALARRVVEDLHLEKRAEFTPGPPTFTNTLEARLRGLAARPFHVLFPRKSEAAEAPSPAEPDRLRGLVSGYLGSLNVTPIGRTRLVTVEFESTNPRLAAEVVNAHAERFIDRNLEARFDATQVASKFLSNEMQNMRAQLEKAEDVLQAYSKQHQIVFVQEGRNTEAEKLSTLEASYLTAQRSRIEKESLAKQIRSQGGTVSDPSKSPLNATFSVRLIDLRREDSDLAVSFGPDWPRRARLRAQIDELEKAVQDEKVQIISRAEAEYASALDEERSIQEQLTKQRETFNRLQEDIIQYNILKKEADSTRQLYDSLLTRLQEANVSSSLKASNIRIVDRAEIPMTPVRPDKLRNLMLSLLAGLGLGVGFAFFQNYMDNSIKTPDDVLKFLKLPTLAIVPRLQSTFGKRGNGYGYGYQLVYGYVSRLRNEKTESAETEGKSRIVERITVDAPSTVLSESYRSLRASLILSAADHPPKVTLITSAVPSEGKTATATNLAITLTQIGARVLMIDADMRRPRAGHIFAMKNVVGLSNFLTGVEELKDTIHPSNVPNLFVMPCGAIPPNPSELVLSSRFRKMIETVREYFDYVVIDSPPINNVSDGRIMATIADKVVLVVKAMSTSRQISIRAIEHLKECKAQIAGVVLNDYNLHAKGGYHYLYYSGRYHSYYSYYTPSDASRQIGNDTNAG